MYIDYNRKNNPRLTKYIKHILSGFMYVKYIKFYTQFCVYVLNNKNRNFSDRKNIKH